MDELHNIWPDWEIIEVIGQGSYGSVLKARKMLRGYDAVYSAIKVVTIPLNLTEVNSLLSSGMDKQTVRKYYSDMAHDLIAEISIMTSLNAVSEIVHIQDFKIVEDYERISWRIYIRMELLHTLNEYTRQQHFTVANVGQLGIDICRGLAKCHEKDIIHRDIKPANILVDDYGTFKLGDFGIARQVENNLAPSSKAGSENYMAPEVYRGSKYDRTADIYSLGVTLYQLLNKGRLPFLPSYPNQISSQDIERARQQRLTGTPMPPPEDVDEVLSKIVLKACAYNPRERYQRAEDMLNDLLKWQRGESVKIRRPGDEGKNEVPVFLKAMIGGLAGIVVVFSVVIALIVFPLNKRNKVDLLHDVDIVYESEGNGKYRINKEKTKFYSSYDQKSDELNEFVRNIETSDYTFSQESELSEGDYIDVSVHVSQDALKKYSVKLEKETMRVEVLIDSTVEISSIDGTSTVTREGSDYDPNNVIDKDPETAWITSGKGNSITFTFTKKCKIRSIDILNGYCKNNDLFDKNSKIKTCTLTFDDGEVKLSLKDVYNIYQHFDLDQVYISSKMTLKIDETYDGWKYKDTCISEISFNSSNAS